MDAVTRDKQTGRCPEPIAGGVAVFVSRWRRVIVVKTEDAPGQVAFAIVLRLFLEAAQRWRSAFRRCVHASRWPAGLRTP